MKIKTTFEFSDGTTITLTKEHVEELRAALAPAPAPVLPPNTKPFPRDSDNAIFDEILRDKQKRDAARETRPLRLYPLDHEPWQRPNFGPRMWDGTEWIGTPIPILCETTQ